MDVRVEAGPLAANSCMVESRQIVETIFDVVIKSPTVSRFSLAPIISIGGTSISAITPTHSRIGVWAAV